jgi:hypothetical protein
VRNTYKILVGNLKRTVHLGDMGVDGRILKWMWSGFSWLRIEASVGLF